MSYFDNFAEVDEEEEVQAIKVAIEVSNFYPSPEFVTNLLKLATLDRNMQIRDLAIKTLEKTYHRKILSTHRRGVSKFNKLLKILYYRGKNCSSF